MRTRGPCGPSISRSLRSSPARRSSSMRFATSLTRWSCPSVAPARGLGRAGLGVRRGLLGLANDPQLGRWIPEVRLGLAVDEVVDRSRGRIALEPAAAIVRPRIRAVVGLARDIQPQFLEHRAVVGLRGSKRAQEGAHHHSVQARPYGEPLELPEVLDAPSAEAEQGVGEDQAEDRDPLDDLPRVHQIAIAELRPGPGIEEVDWNRGGVDLGELEGHLDTLARSLAEVEDSADAALEAGLLDRVDGANAALVADRRGDLGVIGARRLDVVVDALNARILELAGAVGRDMAHRDAALEIRVLGDEPSAAQDLLEVPRRQSLTLRDHAEAVGARGLGSLRVLEDLLGLHHGVHGRVGLGVSRLRAEPAVLGAAA